MSLAKIVFPLNDIICVCLVLSSIMIITNQTFIVSICCLLT